MVVLLFFVLATVGCRGIPCLNSFDSVKSSIELQT